VSLHLDSDLAEFRYLPQGSLASLRLDLDLAEFRRFLLDPLSLRHPHLMKLSLAVHEAVLAYFQFGLGLFAQTAVCMN